MRIGIDIRNIGKRRTGDEAVFLNLVKNLARIDSTNEYRLFTDITDATLLPNMVVKLGIEGKNNFEIVPLKTANKFTWNLWTLPNYLRKNPVDVYHTQYIVPFFMARSIKIITHIHDISFNFYPQFIRWTDLLFLKTLIPWGIRRADKVIAVSESAKKEIVEYYKVPEKKIEVVYNAVGENFANINFLTEGLETVRLKYSLPDKFLLYIGTLQPRKNIPFLVEGFSRLKKKMPGHKLVLAGPRGAHNYDTRIDEAIAKNNLQSDVVFPGYVDAEDLPALYGSADIFVFPSLYEGFGIPLLEAMSAGVPVAAADIPVFREVAGEAALYFDPTSVDEMEKIVYNISINPELREKLKNSGQARIQLFSWAKSAQKMLGIYKDFDN